MVGEYTPYELTILAKQKSFYNQSKFESDLSLAWHTEAFARQKKLPKLEKIIKDSRRPHKNQISKSDAILKAMAAEKGVIIK
jgi:hypothetical protein